METPPLVVLSWDFHAYPNLSVWLYWQLATAGDKKQQLGFAVCPLVTPLGQPCCKAKHATGMQVVALQQALLATAPRALLGHTGCTPPSFSGVSGKVEQGL